MQNMIAYILREQWPFKRQAFFLTHPVEFKACLNKSHFIVIRQITITAIAKKDENQEY